MSDVTALHEAVKHGDLATARRLLDANRSLANTRSQADPRGPFPLHVAAEFDQAAAAELLLSREADVGLLDTENEATALSWAAFFGRPLMVRVLLAAGSDPTGRNKHGLTPLGCALEGVKGRWKTFSDASEDQWRQCATAITAYGGYE